MHFDDGSTWLDISIGRGDQRISAHGDAGRPGRATLSPKFRDWEGDSPPKPIGRPLCDRGPSSPLFRSDLVRKRVPFYDAQFELCDTDAAYWAFTQADFALAHELLTFSRRQQKSRIAWTFAVGTTPAENLRMLLRYGPTVLSPDEFRRRVRYELAEYVKFHLKQRLRPSRWRQDDFHRFHRRMVRLIKEDSLGEREVVAAMNVVGALLNRSGEGGRPDARIEADRG